MKTTANDAVVVVAYGYRKTSCMTQPYSSRLGSPRRCRQNPTIRGVYIRRNRARRLAHCVSNSIGPIRFADTSFESTLLASRSISSASVQSVPLRTSSSRKRLFRSVMKLHRLSSDSRRNACIGASMGLAFVDPNRF